MITRALDVDHDWTFGIGKNNYLTEQKAIVQDINTRLLSFFRDCFFDMDAGIDWFRLLGTKSTEQEIILSCRGVILQSFGVVRVNSISSSVSGRRIYLTYNIDTIYTTQFSQALEVMPHA
jgi:hypothetical protein